MSLANCPTDLFPRPQRQGGELIYTSSSLAPRPFLKSLKAVHSACRILLSSLHKQQRLANILPLRSLVQHNYYRKAASTFLNQYITGVLMNYNM